MIYDTKIRLELQEGKKIQFTVMSSLLTEKKHNQTVTVNPELIDWAQLQASHQLFWYFPLDKIQLEWYHQFFCWK